MKGLPLAYDRDLQEDKPAVFTSVDGTLDSLEAAGILVERLRFDRDRIAAAAHDPSLLATDAAEELVRAGTPFRRAHEKVGEAVREGTMKAPWTAERSLAKRDVPGGPSPRRVKARAQAVARAGATLRTWAKAHPPRLPL
jgi:argininosuccinate lyase